MLEKALISAVVHTREETVYRVDGVDAARLFAALAEAARQRRHDRPDRPRDRLLGARRGRARRASARSTRSASPGRARDDLGKVTVIGAGMKSHPGVAAKTFATLERERDRAGSRLDLADQDRLPRRDRPTSTAPSRRCTRRSTLASRETAADRRRRRHRRRRHGHARAARASAATRTCARSPRHARPASTLGGHTGRGGDARGARARRRRHLSSSRSAPAPRASSSRTPSRGGAIVRRQVVGLPARPTASRSSSPR